MLLITAIILIIIFTEVRFKIINIIDDTNVYIEIGILKINLDYDMFISNLNKVRTKTKFDYNEFKKGIGYYNVIKDIINKSNVQILSCNIIKNNNNFNIREIYINVTYYTIYSFFKNYLIANTSKQKNISFVIIPSENNDIDFDIDFKFSLLLFIKSCFLNFKNIIKIKKDMI